MRRAPTKIECGNAGHGAPCNEADGHYCLKCNTDEDYTHVIFKFKNPSDELSQPNMYICLNVFMWEK